MSDGVLRMDGPGGDWLPPVLGTAAGAIVTGVVTWLRTRKTERANMKRTMFEAAQEAAHMVVADLTSLVTTLRQEVSGLRGDLIAERKACDARLAAQQHQINQLMKGGQVTYGDDTGGPHD